MSLSKSCVLVCVLTFGAASAADLPVFNVPRMPKPPIIDGKIDMRGWPADEWSATTHLMGFMQAHKRIASTSTEHARVGYDDRFLYVACSIGGIDAADIRCAAKHNDTTAWGDESVEVHVGVGEAPHVTYQFVVNADDLIYDAKDEGGKHDKGWNGEWQHRTTRSATTWETEVAIPWTTLGIASPAVGQVLRLNIGHNHTLQGVDTPEVSAWGPLMDAKGKSHTFNSLATLPLVLLTGDAPTAGATFTIEKGDKPVVRIRAFNPGTKDVTLPYCVLKEFWNPLLVPAGKFNGIPVEPRLGEDGLGEQPIRVKSEAGEIIFNQLMPVRSRVGASIGMMKYFPLNRVEIVVEAALPKDSKAEIVVKDDKGAEVSRNVTPLPGGKPNPIPVDIAALKESVAHTLTVTLQDAAGEKIGARFFTVTRPPTPPWLGTKAGITDQPIAPFIPIRVQNDAFSCLLKEYQFKDRSLPAGIRSEGHELLFAPIRLELTVGEKTAEVASQPIRITASKANRVEWESPAASVQGLFVSHSGWMEEDGFMWCTVTFDAPKPMTVDGLQLLIPIRREIALFYNGTLCQQPDKYDELGRVKDAGHEFQSFMAMINVLNYERGLCVTTDNPVLWRPKDLQRCESIAVTKDAATLRYGMIEKATVFSGKRTIEFGLMAMPAKPVDRKAASRRMVHDIRYDSATMSCGISGASRVEYPVEGNLDSRRGTLEVRFFADWDATLLYPDPDWRWYLSRRLLKITDDEKNYAMLFWNAHMQAWEFDRGPRDKAETKIELKTPLPWPKPAWHHVALTWGDKIRLYADGKLMGETDATGLLPKEMADLQKARMIFGKEDKSYRSEYRIAALRISSAPLSPDQMALDGKFSLRPDTLFLQDFAGAAEGKTLPAPQKGRPGKLMDAAEITAARGEPALTFGPIPDLSRIEMLARMNVKIVGYHDHWTRDYGAPWTPYPLSLRTLIDACHKNGMRLVVYSGYGLGHMAPESILYEDYWRVEPVHVWAGQGPSYFIAACNNVPVYTDYQIAGIARLFKDFALDGMYYDHVQTPQACVNTRHGCGVKDEAGLLLPTTTVRSAREYIKRLYQIVHSVRPDAFIDCHGSGYVSPVRAAWVDRMWIGELYMRVPRTFENFSIECRGEPYGMPSDFLVVNERKPGEFEGSWAYTMLYDMEPRAIVWIANTVDSMAKLWKVKDAFDTDNAEWWPFWRNAEYASVIAPDCYTSLYLYSGKRALVAVSNVGTQPAAAAVSLNLKKMGLSGKARDAFTGEPVELKDSRTTFQLAAPGLKLLWVE